MFSETKLYDLWFIHAKSAEILHWNNHSLVIKNSGELNTNSGPDFSGALFEFDGTEYAGQVEIHRFTEDWYRHGHHKDKNYAHVLLHIVSSKCPNPKSVRTVYGRFIPVFVLDEDKIDDNSIFVLPYSKKYKSISKLKVLALEQLKIKVAYFRKQYSLHTFQSILFSGLMCAMGYPNNKSAFELLSFKVPAHYLNSPYQAEIFLAYLMGISGFLNYSYTDSYSKYLKDCYSDLKSSLMFSEIAYNNWQFAGLRPRNHPHFRLAAISFLLLQKTTAHLFFEYLLTLFSSRPSFELLYKKLSSLFSIQAKGYWKKHYALDKILTRSNNKRMIGSQRFVEILINIIIPLLIAFANKTKSYGYVNYLEEFYFFVPDPGLHYHKIEKKIPWFAECHELWPKAACWQAMLQLERLHFK